MSERVEEAARDPGALAKSLQESLDARGHVVLDREDWAMVIAALASSVGSGERRGASADADRAGQQSPSPQEVSAADAVTITSRGDYQKRCAAWMDVAFSDDATEYAERRDRFVEEALEVAHALGLLREDAQHLVDYVWGRPTGMVAQEIGQSAFTLGCLAAFIGVDMMGEAERELARCSTPEFIAKLAAKRATRHGRGPLPGFSGPGTGAALALGDRSGAAGETRQGLDPKDESPAPRSGATPERSPERSDEVAELRAALVDMLSGWRYIRGRYGDLDGVGWDRCEQSASAALASIPAPAQTPVREEGAGDTVVVPQEPPALATHARRSFLRAADERCRALIEHGAAQCIPDWFIGAEARKHKSEVCLKQADAHYEAARNVLLADIERAAAPPASGARDCPHCGQSAEMMAQDFCGHPAEPVCAMSSSGARGMEP